MTDAAQTPELDPAQQAAQATQDAAAQDAIYEKGLNAVNKAMTGGQFLDADDLPDGVNTDTGLPKELEDGTMQWAGVGGQQAETPPPVTMVDPATPAGPTLPNDFLPSGSALYANLDVMAVHNDEVGQGMYSVAGEPLENPGMFSFTEPQPNETDEAFVTGGQDFEKAKAEWLEKEKTARADYEKKYTDYITDVTHRRNMQNQQQADAVRRGQTVQRGWGAVRKALESQGVTGDQIKDFMAIAHQPETADNKKPALHASAVAVMQAIISEGQRIVPAMKQLVTQPELAEQLFSLPPEVASRKVGILIGQAMAQSQRREDNNQQLQQAAAVQGGGGLSLYG